MYTDDDVLRFCRVQGSAIATVLFGLLACASAEGQEVVSGAAQVVDGDGLRIGEATIRLFGIDAVEGAQTCQRDGAAWACGEEAAAALRRLVDGQTVRCEVEDRDRYGRLVSTCFLADGRDINGAQVRAGWAVAYTDFSDRYVDDERQAREARLGIWSSDFVRPSDYRAAQRSASASPTDAPLNARCTIKGNISSRSGTRIYHVPGQENYADTRIDTGDGERWFCTEEDAVAAGWRRARR